MNSLITLISHPFLHVKVGPSDDGETGIDVLYPLSLFFALGIWLVFQRYQKMHNSAVPFSVAVPVAADPNWNSFQLRRPHLESHRDIPDIRPMFELHGKKSITSYDPATGLHINTFVADDATDINEKISRARNAQKSWRSTTFTQRKRVIRSLLKWLVDNQDVCARVACRDSGKTLIDAALGEILTTCSKMEWLLKHGEKYLSPETRSSNLVLLYKKSQVIYEPLGVVAAIVSWNYPLHNAWSPILAALFAGNSIVLKCSENVIWSTGWYIEVIQKCLSACGHDPDLVQLVCCWPEEAEALTRSPVIKHITFIGSEAVGRKVAMAATEYLTPVTLELGGKDPAVILPGTDLNKWAPLWKRGVFQNMGQNCIGIERLIVHKDQYDDLYDIFAEMVPKLRVGSVLAPTPEGWLSTIDCGSMISHERFPALEKIIRDAQEAGADVVGGVTYNHNHVPQNGAYFTPTLVGPVDPSMDIAREELFAPVAVLMSYESIDEAIEIANGTRYGLAASVFGPDQRQALKVAKRLECGMVSVNDFGVFYVNQDLPFGGFKNSGYGRFGGPEGLRSLTNIKAIMVDRWPAFIQTSIPRVLDYPVRSLAHSWAFTSNLIRFLYATGWRARIRGLFALRRAAAAGVAAAANT